MDAVLLDSVEVRVERALVTGGCGFLGSWIVKKLRERGTPVRVLAARGESRDNLEGVEAEILEGDIRSTEDCARAAAFKFNVGELKFVGAGGDAKYPVVGGGVFENRAGTGAHDTNPVDGGDGDAG